MSDKTLIAEALALGEERIAAEDANDAARVNDWRWKALTWFLGHQTRVLALLLEQDFEITALKAAYDTSAGNVRRQAAEITRLRALLPQTADGVLVADCEAVYCPDCGIQMRLNSDGRHAACFGCRPLGASRYLNLSECLSKPKGSE